MDPFERGSSRRRQYPRMTSNMLRSAMHSPAPPCNLARIRPTDFAGLFSGEDAHETPTRPRDGGLLRATANLLADSVRTLVDSSQMRGSSQAFARRAT